MFETVYGKFVSLKKQYHSCLNFNQRTTEHRLDPTKQKQLPSCLRKLLCHVPAMSIHVKILRAIRKLSQAGTFDVTPLSLIVGRCKLVFINSECDQLTKSKQPNHLQE